MYKAVIADDEYMIRCSLKKIIEEHPANLRVVAEAINGQEALELIALHKPDIVFTDVRMPKISGLQLAEEIIRTQPELFVVVVSGYDEFAYIREALQHHVQDYILKPIDCGQIHRAIEKFLESVKVNSLKSGRAADHYNEFRLYAERTAEALWSNDQAGVEHLLGTVWFRLHTLFDRESLRKPFGYIFLEQLLEELNKRTSRPALAPEQLAGIYERDTKSCLYETVSALQAEITAARNWSHHYRIRKALQYIQQHFTEESMSLMEVAAQADMLPTSFSQAFKQEMRQTYMQYVIRLRMSKAQQLLERTELNAYEIAARIGYANYAHFNKAFKKFCGDSPKEYRNRFYSNRSEDG